jgi:hypothetical protein
LLAALDDVLGRIHRGGALSGELTRLARGRARLARSPLPDPPGRG